MWIFIWLVLSVFVLGFSFWSFHVLWKQKQSWKTFAKKYNLKYQSNSLTESPSLTGVLGQLNVAIFAGIQESEDVRGQRFLTIIEFDKKQEMPTGAAIGSDKMKPLVETLVFDQIYEPSGAKWPQNKVFAVREKEKLIDFLTQDRLDALTKLFELKSIEFLYIFDEKEAVLRIETIDPMQDAEKMERMIKKLASLAKPLLINS